MVKRVRKESERKRAEIERLRKRLRELEGDSYKEVPKKSKNKYVRLLVILIIILIVVDVISVIAFYRPDFSNIIKFNTTGSSVDKSDNSNSDNGNAKCSDGTANGSCSKNKPLYCYSKQLVNKASLCGCPSGYKQDFQSCVKI